MLILNNNLSFCCYKKGKSDDAIKHAKYAIELDSSCMKAFYRLYQAYEQKSDLEQAEKALK